MTTVDFITELFCRVADKLVEQGKEKKHSQGKLYASEIVTLALLYSLKGVEHRAFWRWLLKDYRPLFPKIPTRTRLFRLFNSHQSLVDTFLAKPSLLGVLDSYGIELLHPRPGTLWVRAQSSANRQERQVKPALDCRWQTLFRAQSPRSGG